MKIKFLNENKILNEIKFLNENKFLNEHSIKFVSKIFEIYKTTLH